MKELFDLSQCSVCPRECLADRTQGKGVCGADSRLKISLATLHYGEEPVLSGFEAHRARVVTSSQGESLAGGSGTIFFSHCNLRCIYCQNYQISHLGQGRHISEEDLLNIIFGLQDQGALNINLVSPTQYTAQLIPILQQAKAAGLRIPIVWNSNAYEKVECIRALGDLVDIWLPDLKYADKEHARKYSGITDYPAIAINAIKAMWGSAGELQTDFLGVATKGVMIRHLVLPNGISSSKEALHMIYDAIGNTVSLSLMAQYYPTASCAGYPELSRSITYDEYQEVLDVAEELGFENIFAQELRPTPDWTPDFDR
ncbi:MAG: radical SAM protein [Candidatus Cloacimonadaceae bacterium]